MRNPLRIVFIVLATAMIMSGFTSKEEELTLKEVLAKEFYIGVALNEKQITGQDTLGLALVKKQFNSIVAENCMKSAIIHPAEDRYNFTLADQFVEWGVKNHMYIIGHTLIWHSQLSPWFLIDQEGKEVTREVLIERMRNHITTLVTRYKGRVKGWDVVNEAFTDEGTYRDSKFYRIIGEDFIPLAFQFAHEADPKAELYYNDYSMFLPGRRAAVVKLIHSLKEKGIRIDGVGMQAHLSLTSPSLEEFEKSVLAFAATGVNVHITELDMTVLPWPSSEVSAEVSARFDYQQKMNPYPHGLPEKVSRAWNHRMSEFFKLFRTHRDKIKRVTMWGLADSDSWRNNWPIQGRTDYPLLFDKAHQPKAVVDSILSDSNIQ